MQPNSPNAVQHLRRHSRNFHYQNFEVIKNIDEIRDWLGHYMKKSILLTAKSRSAGTAGWLNSAKN